VDGTWAVTPELADGSYTVSATSVDAAGNPATATPVRFQVDTVAPEAPAIDLPTDGTPVAGKTIYGSAEVGDTVTVTIDGTDYEAKVDTSGRWSVDIDGLEDGPHTIIATATDEAGNSSETTVNFTLDNTAPSNPVITIPAHNGDTNKDKAEGTAEPGSTVTIVIDGQTTVTTKAGDDGKWEVTLPGLGQGEHTLVATATDEAGNVSGETKSKFKYDTVAPAEPVITTPKADETVTTDEITVSGTAEPGSTVTIYVDGKEHGTATADAEGKWSHEIKGLDNGKYQIEVTATDKAGNTSAKKKLEFTRDYTADPDINGGGGSNDHDTNSGGNSGGSGDDGSGSGGSDSDGDLPFTGSDTLPLLGIGGLLTALGGAFAAIRKRRK
jgi:LPXTG-motif cell wall-anchored protein